MSCGSGVMAQQNVSKPKPEKTNKQTKNTIYEAKMKVIMIILGISY